MKGTHVMLDFETFGQRPSTAVLSLGAVMFTAEGIVCEQEWFFNPGEQFAKGRTFDFDTIKWWMQQSDEARKKIHSPTQALVAIGIFKKQFVDFISGKDVKMWGNGADFDCAILNDIWTRHQNDFNHPLPWKFFNTRCFRTINAAHEIKKLVAFDGVKHSAIADARYQANCVIAYLRTRQ